MEHASGDENLEPELSL